jgi:hypothetical protein
MLRKKFPLLHHSPMAVRSEQRKAVEFYKAAFGAVEVIASKIPVEAWSPGFP